MFTRVNAWDRNQNMSLSNVMLLTICIFLIAYLLYALLKAEEF